MNNKQCPIQIVDEMQNGKVYRTWIVLLSNINYQNKTYTAIRPFHKFWIEEEQKYINKFHKPNRFNKIWISKFFFKETITSTFATAPMEHWDVIRNPTIKEIKFIQQIFKINGYNYNRKTNQLIKI